MMRNCVMLLAVLCAVGVISGAVSADVPLVLSHQGRLLDGSDNPVTGTRDLTFRIYETPTGGTPLWTETHLSVPVTNGLYSVILGSTVTISGDLIVTGGALGTERFLEIEVQSDGPMSPRSRMVASPYSVASSRVSGDVHTLPGELSVSGFGGSTTGTIRASQNPGSEGSEIELVDGNGSTTGTIRVAGSTGAQVLLSDHGGSTTGTIRMQASPDSAVSTSGLDLNGDGVPDVATAMEAIESRNILKSYFETGDIPSQARFVTQYGESDMELSVTEVDELHTATVAADSTGSELRLLQMPLGGGVSGTTSGKISVGHGSGGGGGGGLGGDAFTVTGTFQDVTSEDVTEMKAARKDITINLRHSDLTGVEGDQTAAVAVDSFGSELRIGSGPLSGMSGSTTGTIRVGLTNVPGSGVGQPAYRATGNYSDGTNESSIEQVSDATGARSILEERHGSTTGTIRMMATADSVGNYLDDDDDGDGFSEAKITITARDQFGNPIPELIVSSDIDDDGFMDRRYVLRSGASAISSEMTVDDDNDGVVEQNTKQYVDSDLSSFSTSSRFGSGPRQTTSMDGSFSHAQSRVATDMEEDGIPDIVIGARTEADSAVLKGYFERGDKPTQSQFANLLDSDGARSVLSGMSGSTTGTIRMMASPDSAVAASEIGDGSSSSSSNMRTRINDLETKLQTIGLLGTARVLTKTSPVSASDECRWVQDDTPDGETVYMSTICDSTGVVTSWSQNDDADDFPNIKVRTDLKTEFGISRGGVYLDSDSDNDGVSDVSAELVVDEDSASFRLNGLPPGLPVIETISMKATPSSVYMAVGAATCDGTDWINASDVNSKENFEPVDGEEILDKISDLEITRWNYKGKNEVEHIGPTAQDFKKAFGVGADEKSISTIDPSGIALAAIKELNKQNQELAKQNQKLQKELENLKKQVQEIVSKR